MQDKWLKDSSFKGIIQQNHPQSFDKAVCCLLCQKIIHISYQGKSCKSKLASQCKYY